MNPRTAIPPRPKRFKSQAPFLSKKLRRVLLAHHSLQMGAQLSSKPSDSRPALQPSRERDHGEELDQEDDDEEDDDEEDDDEEDDDEEDDDEEDDDEDEDEDEDENVDLNLLLKRRRKRRRSTAFTEDLDDHEEGRPAKRGKSNHLVRHPSAQVVSGSKVTLPFHKSAPLTPAAKPPDWSINRLLPRTPREFEGGLTVDVCGIRFARPNSVELALSKLQNGPLEIQCSCSVTIKCRISKKAWQDRCQYRKQFTLLITPHDDKIERGFVYPEDGGFLFLPKDLYVNRRPRGGHGGVEEVFDLADEYRAFVTIERVGFHKSWPLIDIQPDMSVSRALDRGEATLKDLTLLCMTPLQDPDQQRRSHPLQLCYENYKQSIDYTLDLRVQWSLPHSATPFVSKIPKCDPPVLLALSRTPTASPTNQTREENPTLNNQANRSQRQRVNVPTYNLKSLSAQAQGRSPRKPREPRQQSRDVRTRSPSQVGERDRITVSYGLGKADAADIGVKQQSVFPGLHCPFCNYPSRTFDFLTVHLRNSHGNFKFSVRKPPPRAAFFIDLVKSRPAQDTERWKTIQIGRPRTLFDLEKYLNGDDSWAESRRGPQHYLLAELPFSSSSSPQGTRQSSPNTSAISEDVEPSVAKATSSRPKLPVPQTPRPLFHQLTKAPLKPADDIPSSDEDDTWFEQRYRDVVNDFEDLTVCEKEYFNQWNPFVTKRGATTPLTIPYHLPAAVLEFVKLNKRWLNQKERKREFTMHCQALVLRNVMKDELFSECLEILRREAKRMEARAGRVVDEEEVVEKVREKQDCICLKPASTAHNVVCRGTACNYRFYHRECVINLGRPIRDRWLCDDCFSLESAA